MIIKMYLLDKPLDRIADYKNYKKYTDIAF